MPTFAFEREDRQLTLAAFLRRKLSLSWSQAKTLIETDKVFINGQKCRQVDQRPKIGAQIEVREPAQHTSSRPRPVAPRPERTAPVYEGPTPKIVYLDGDLVVVDKPAGLTTMRDREEAEEFGAGKRKFLPATLADLLPGLLGEPNHKVTAVHRIDRDTSGLVVFARNRPTAQKLEDDFRAHRLERRYLALTRGVPPEGRLESYLVRDRGDGRRGSGSESAEGAQKAVSYFHVQQTFGDYALVECRLETGRTHQVRIHLGEAGAPLCGEKIYDRPLHGKPVPDESGATRQLLHAAVLGLTHPTTGQTLKWESELPTDMQRVLDRLIANS
ncbi:RluA family pseudouridine synthase [Telmatocola sphagniphila]|uniref:RluA family pseudouridine synthase n=1 Tax=Telmatocola sphagniphila TaxID=1123043 RepID=A0A8E6B3W4_9BACT|nr:RluA family pseudouridine synthase [Telmatocola sphagniphila]QVL30651.1 RluA family pseudouridine synthase [Telmatocola sphagniphila]